MSEWPTIPPEIANAIVSHAVGAYPEECLGLVCSREGDGEWVAIVPLDNVAVEARVSHAADPDQQREAEIEMERQNYELAAIYHSHPRGGAGPSKVDVALASLRPGLPHLIWSFADERLGAFRVNGAGEVEVALGAEREETHAHGPTEPPGEAAIPD